MKGFVKKLLSCTLAAAMICTLVPAHGEGSTGSKVEAAGGTWTLVSSKDMVSANSDTNGSIRNYSYEGEVNGRVRFKTTGSAGKDSNGNLNSSTNFCEGQIPSSSIGKDDTITLTMKIWGEGVSGYGIAEQCYYKIDQSDLGNGSGTGSSRHLVDSGGKKYYYTINGTDGFGPTEVNVSGKFWDNPSDGDYASIYFCCYAGTYEWKYQFKASGSSSTTTSGGDDDATTIGEDSDDEDLGQVKNVKLTNKKVKRIYIKYDAVSGATGYEIRYSTNRRLSGAKKMNASTTKGYFKNAKGKKATFKKGKTYYVQVRAFAKDSSGEKVYGPWSAKKKVKIKK